MNYKIEKDIKKAVEEFEGLLREQYLRNEKMHQAALESANNKDQSKKTVIGLADGDGIGPVIMKETEAVLRKILEEPILKGQVELKKIEGFTLENRLEKGQTVPEDVLKEMQQCDVLLKGPTTTPSVSMNTKNLESANVFLRRTFDLYANVRPVSVLDQGIDWTFFRENTEGEYALGNRGIKIGEELNVDFKITTKEGTYRIARAAYEFARANGKKRVSIVTKANILKKTDGEFLRICKAIGEEYPDIETDTWFIDIMAANLVNTDIRNQFQVFLLPNLYGDILTDEAAQIQGGVGTAGSANIGSNYALFEAIHGSAPRMVEEGIQDLANPASLMKSAAMLLSHIGYVEESVKLEEALAYADEKIGTHMTGQPGGASCKEFAALVMEKL